jgi:hypothetical protein
MDPVAASLNLLVAKKDNREMLTEGLPDNLLAHQVGVGTSNNQWVQQILEILIKTLMRPGYGWAGRST